MKKLEMGKCASEFHKTLLSSFPEMGPHIVPKVEIYKDWTGEEVKDSYFELHIPHGEELLSITTIDDEITIGFGDYHRHFILEGKEDAVKFLKQLFKEEVIIWLEYEGDNQLCGGLRTKEEYEKMIKLQPKNEKAEYIITKSWNGTYTNKIGLKE